MIAGAGLDVQDPEPPQLDNFIPWIRITLSHRWKPLNPDKD